MPHVRRATPRQAVEPRLDRPRLDPRARDRRAVRWSLRERCSRPLHVPLRYLSAALRTSRWAAREVPGPSAVSLRYAPSRARPVVEGSRALADALRKSRRPRPRKRSAVREELGARPARMNPASGYRWRRQRASAPHRPCSPVTWGRSSWVAARAAEAPPPSPSPAGAMPCPGAGATAGPLAAAHAPWGAEGRRRWVRSVLDGSSVP